MKIYVYPDGTMSSNKPVDGQVFVIYDSKQSATSMWQWDGLKEQWYDVTTRPKIKQYDLGYSWTKKKLCECGGEKTGSNRHSTWCPKYA